MKSGTPLTKVGNRLGRGGSERGAITVNNKTSLAFSQVAMRVVIAEWNLVHVAQY